MKKIIFSAMTLVMLVTLSPQAAHAETKSKEEVVNLSLSQKEADALVDRLYEINQMDRSEMSSFEKKELRHEVLSIKDQLDSSPVIYISGGALILIIILLIILL